MRSTNAVWRGGRATALLIALLAAAGLASGCRSKLDVKTKSGGALPPEVEPPPEEIVDDEPVDDEEDPVKKDPEEVNDVLSLQGEKLYFQTRDIITISIDKSVLEGGTTYRLLNTTKHKYDDPKAIELAKGDIDALGLHGGFALVASGDKLQFQFFPGEADWAGKFFYGKNTLTLFVDDEEQPRYSITELFLVDFDVFGVAVTAFADNVQVASASGANGYQFQGWVNVLSPPTVKATGTVLTHGIFNMVNPQ
jgi:hypothetical protein